MMTLLALFVIGVRVFGDDGSVQDFGTVPTTTVTTTTTTTTATVATSTVTTTTQTTTTTLPLVSRAINVRGYMGQYDANGPTVPAWPLKPNMAFIQGENGMQGPLVASARARALAAGNHPRFLFYFDLTGIDSRCGCFDQQFYTQRVSLHPEWILKSSSGANVATTPALVGRMFAMDIGNPAYGDAWMAFALGAIDQYGWDGTFADDVIRCNDFVDWSAKPINPRTHVLYTCAQYRADLGNLLAKIKFAYDARGKFLLGNHGGAWHASAFNDPLIKQQITLMHGVNLEDCVYSCGGSTYSETEWLEQLAYMDYANRNGVMVNCQACGGAISNAAQREHVLATGLLTKEGLSGIAEVNTVANWSSLYDSDLGTPESTFECITPTGAILPRGLGCPAPGNTYRRRWTKGVVAVNPISGVSRTIPLGRTTTCGTSVTITGPGGRVCP